MLHAMRVEGVIHRSKTSEEAFTFLWQNCGGREMVTLDMLRAGKNVTSYAYYREGVVYVCQINSLICACEAKNLAKLNESHRCVGCFLTVP